LIVADSGWILASHYIYGSHTQAAGLEGVRKVSGFHVISRPGTVDSGDILERFC